MKKLLFILFAALVACNPSTPSSQQHIGNNSLQTEVDRVVGHFCKGQRLQFEMADARAKGTLTMEKMDELGTAMNKHMENYTVELDALMKKHKGNERKVYNLLKSGQMNCK
jgi:hypothetical protein